MIMSQKENDFLRKFFSDLREQVKIGKKFLGLQGKNWVFNDMSWSDKVVPGIKEALRKH